MRILFTIIVLSFTLVSTAHASFWIECEVSAVLTETEAEGKYNALIKKAVVTDGHDAKGGVCIKDLIGKNTEIEIEGTDIPVGESILLKYNFYNGMGPDGVVNVTSWKY